MYACQLMVPCVDSALKSTKSSPRLGAVRGQGSGLRVSCAGSQWGACERKTREGLGAVRAHVRSAVLAQFAVRRTSICAWRMHSFLKKRQDRHQLWA